MFELTTPDRCGHIPEYHDYYRIDVLWAIVLSNSHTILYYACAAIYEHDTHTTTLYETKRNYSRG